MIFIDNKYTKWYYAIVQNANLRVLPEDIYVEKHHIIPRSLDGGNSKENLVKLTAREHFVCHLLLTKMVTGPARFKMLSAVTRFQQSKKYQKRILTSWEYQKVRECAILARAGQRHTEESCRKIKERNSSKEGANNPMYGKFGADNHHSKHYWAVDPSGNEYDFIGLTQFCKLHNLYSSSATTVAQGKHAAHKGWKFGYVDKNGNKINPNHKPKNTAGSNNGNSKTYKFIDPSNQTYLVTGQLITFCKNNNLGLKSVRACIQGRRESYKGWTIHYC